MVADNKIENTKVKKPAIDRLLKILMILSIIGTIVSILLAIIPVQTFLVGLCIQVVGGIFAALCGIGTLGLAFITTEVRNFFNNWFSVGKKIMDGAESFYKYLRKPYPFVIGAFGIIIVTFLVLSIINFRKDHAKYKAKLIMSILFTIAFAACTLYSALIIFAVIK